MAKPTLTAKTGNAEIVKMGHTTDGEHGSDPSFRPASKSVRNLEVKGSGGGR